MKAMKLPRPDSPGLNPIIVFWILAVLAGALGLALTAWSTCGFGGCPDVDKLHAWQPGGAPLLLDRTGEPFADLAPFKGDVVPLKSIPRHVIDAFVAVEDRRFWDHGGIDWWRAGGAIFNNLREGSMQEGFSTITMQLARNVFPDEIRMNQRTIGRKLLEMRVAGRIEERFSKNEILELYLNHIYFGNGAYGIEAASQHYFRRSAEDLTLAQAALLAALPKAPSHYDPRQHPEAARERRNLVLTLMEKQKHITAAAAEAARKVPLGLKAAPPRKRAEARFGAYFIEEVRRLLEERFGEGLYKRPLRVWTTLDVGLQAVAEEEIRDQLAAIERGRLGRFPGPRYAPGAATSANTTRYLQGALVSLDVRSGDVLAWVGGRDFRQSQFDRVVNGRRQAGSAFKPFVYAAALAEGIPLSRVLADEPLKIQLARGKVWEPRNFSGRFEGEITMRDALVRSVNTATVRLAEEVGYDRIAAVARRAGITSQIDLVPSMALGTVAVSPLELVSAYTAFAGLGRRSLPRLITRVDDADGKRLWTIESESESALDPSVAWLVNDALREAVERGSGAPALESGFRGPAAGKTGTSNDGIDAWFIGYTPDVVTGVWIGFDQPRRIVSGASGGRLAAPVWGRTMERHYRGREPQWWPAPRNVVELQMDPASGLVLEEGCRPLYGPPRTEFFIAGTEPRTICPDWQDSYDQWADSYVYSQGQPPPDGGYPDDPLYRDPDAEGFDDYGSDEEAAEESDVDPETPGDEAATRSESPETEPLATGESTEPGPAGEESRSARDVSGWWDLSNVVESSTVDDFRGLRLDYRLHLNQDGNRISGEGEKRAENGRQIPDGSRTSIEVSGVIDGNQLRLDFTEYGSRRTTGGRFVLRLRENNLSGSFSSSAAGSSGRSSARRVY